MGAADADAVAPAVESAILNTILAYLLFLSSQIFIWEQYPLTCQVILPGDNVESDLISIEFTQTDDIFGLLDNELPGNNLLPVWGHSALP